MQKDSNLLGRTRQTLLCSLILLLTSSMSFSQLNRRMSTPERQLDIKIIKELMQHAKVVIVGEIVEQPLQDKYGPQTYGDYKIKPFSALSENTAFTVQIERVLSGEISTNRPVTVGVVRDEVGFRYPTNKSLIFFLKPGKPSTAKYVSPMSKPAEWRAVSDYFGIIPYTLTIERIVKPPRPVVRDLPKVAPPKIKQEEE